MKRKQYLLKYSAITLVSFIPLLILILVGSTQISPNPIFSMNNKSDCFWQISYQANENSANPKANEVAGFPLLYLSGGETVTTNHCPEMFLVSNMEHLGASSVPVQYFGSGKFIVGKDIETGLYSLKGKRPGEACYWQTEINPNGNNIAFAECVSASWMPTA